MNSPTALLGVFCVLLLLAVLLEPLGRMLRLPFSALLVAVGFAGSEVLVWWLGDIGLRWQHFHTLVLHVFLPVLVFESALQLDPRALRRDLVPILWLAVPLLLVATLLTGALVYAGVAHPVGFPWLTALVAGALLSATDPVAVVALFREIGAPERLQTLVEGESLFNDAGAIALFMLLIAAAVDGGDFSLLAGLGRFLALFLGGLAVGLGVGVLGSLVLRWSRNPVAHAAVSLVVAFFSFYLAEERLHLSGVMAVLAAGLVLNRVFRRDPDCLSASQSVWGVAAFGANAMIFLLLGATVTWAMFASQWLAMLIAIGAVLLVRALLVYGLLPPLRLLPGVTPVPVAYAHVLIGGGLRGAVTAALALSLPLVLEGWYTVQAMAYGVVLFTLFVQAPLMPALVRHVLPGRDAG